MRRKALAIAASLLAAAGWLHHGYWPRERTGLLPSDGPLATVLSRDELPYRAWIAYPHQNLGVLTSSPSWAAAVDLAVELGLPRLALPSFGPLAAPPARALAVATDEAGERVVLAAEVYRLPALAVRFAGWLAGNPWLAGGRVQVEGRTVEVAWQGRTWIVGWGTTARVEKETAGGWAPTAARAIAVGLSSRRAGRLPPGTYQLARRGPALELTSGDARALRPLAPPPPASVAALAAAATGPRFDVTAILPAAPQGDELPDAVVFHRGPGRRWDLPAESLHEMLGRRPEQDQRGAWQMAGSGAEARQAADALIPYLDQLFARSTTEGLRSALWVDLPAARATLGPLARGLARLPIAEARRFAAAATALEGLGGWRSLSAVIVEGTEPAVLARLDP